MDFKEIFAKSIEQCLKKDSVSYLEIYNNIEYPRDLKLGDICLPAFFLAKKLKQNPLDISKTIVDNIGDSNKYFKLSSKGGYVNAFINPEILFSQTIKDVFDHKEDYGFYKEENPKVYTLDTFNTNPFKALHIGHLRNIVLGDAICNLLKYSNQKAHPVYYGGDVGTHVAKWYWYYSQLSSDSKQIPKTNISKWFGDIYLDAGEKLSENPECKKEIDSVQKQILEDPSLQKEIVKLRDICYKGYMQIKDELGITLDNHIFESQSQDVFFKIKDELISKYNDVIYEDQGVIIADLKKYDLDVLVLVKENGAPLYGAKDTGLVKLKKEMYPKTNTFLYIVGSEQEFYFKQLFKLFSIIYPDTNHKHISYGLVSSESKKMSSRKGSIVLYEDFRDVLFNKLKEVLKNNELETNQEVLEKIGYGTIKFEMLKTSLNKNINFNLEEVLDLQGDTCVYVQYSGVRAQSILDKVSEDIDYSLLDSLQVNNLELEEKELLNLFISFKDKVKHSVNNFKPNIIANFCLEMAHTFSSFYSNCPVLNSSAEIRQRRLLMTKAYFIVLENALKLLGISIPKKM